jgi:hypothetical protein
MTSLDPEGGPRQASSAVCRVSSAERLLQAAWHLTNCYNHRMASGTWFDDTMRWAQLTLTDTDPGTYDPDFWLDYFRECRCDGAVISSGGYLAFHPTDIPYHRRASTLGDLDSFGYLVEGCRRMGMAVLCRTDAHATHEEARRDHPEWIAVTEDGRYREHASTPGVWITCALGDYTFDFMTRVNTEIMERYVPDAIFCNRWSGSGICYCDSCRAQFAQATGLEIPLEADADSDAMVAWLEWRERRLFELCDLWDARIRAVNPGSSFIPNSPGGALSTLDSARLAETSDILFIDKQARSGIAAPWANGRNGRELRAVMGRKPIGGIFSVGVEESFRWKDSVQSEPELRVWVAETVANGMRPWFTKFCGRVYDDRWMPVVRDLYRRYAEWEPHLRLHDPVADVAIVFSQATARHYARGRTRDLVDAPINGFYQALVEDRTLFEMTHADALCAARLRDFRAVVLPNVAALSDEQAQLLRDYVAAGGGLVATFETSRYDERGRRRDDFALADLFGAHTGEVPVQTPLKNSYIRVNHDTTMDTSIVHRGLEHAGRVINGGARVDVVAAEPGTAPYSFVPPYPDLPMEEVYPREVDESCPEVFHTRYGEGRVVYIASDLDRRFWEILTPDHGRILANSVRWAAGAPPTVEVTGPGLVDVTLRREKNRYCLHIVNLTNPFAMRGPLREIVPLRGLEVRLRLGALPTGAVRALEANRELDVLPAEEGDATFGARAAFRIALPEIAVHEAVVFEM